MYTAQNPIVFPRQPKAIHKADDGDVALMIRYKGSEASATVTVAAGGDITLKHGDASSEAADTTIQIGATPGAIDVSDGDGDTLGEVVDHINGSANWEAYIVDGIRADSSDDTLLTKSETTLTPGVDEPLYKDTSVALNLSVRLGSRASTRGTEEQSAAEIYKIVSKNTFGSGTNKIQVYEMDELTNEETKIFEVDGAATTVEQTDEFVVNGRGAIATAKSGKHLLVRMIGSAACTGYLQVVGAVARGK